VKTVQLRRYTLKPELIDEFLVWWPTLLAPAREAAGFTIEFAQFVPVTGEFVWSVSVPGDVEAFNAVDAAWAGSPERIEVFGGRGPWTAAATIHFVEIYR
jgi:hypothetical protein